MVKLPSKRDIAPGTGPAPRGTGIQIARPQVNPRGAQAFAPDIPEISEDVIPDLPTEDFSSERNNIAALKRAEARYMGDVGRAMEREGRYKQEAGEAKADQWLSWQKELTKLSALAEEKKKEQDTKDWLEGSTAYEIGMAEIRRKAQMLPPPQRPAYIKQESEALTDRLGGQFSSQEGKDRFATIAEGANRKAEIDALSDADKAEREQSRVDSVSRLQGLADELMQTEPDDITRQQSIVTKINEELYATGPMGLALHDPAVQADLMEKFGPQLAEKYVETVAEVDPKRAQTLLNGWQASKKIWGHRESGGDFTRQNNLGYAGKYQFGAPRLKDLGFYEFAPGEGYSDPRGWYGPKFQGKFKIPGFKGTNGGDLLTIEDFLANEEAQEFVMDKHIEDMNNYIAKKGYDKRLGERINGVPVTIVGMHGAFHIGGSGGLNKVMGGGDSKADAFGTSSFDYFKYGARHDIASLMDPARRKELAYKVNQATFRNDLINNLIDGNITTDDIDAIRAKGLIPNADDYMLLKNKATEIARMRKDDELRTLWGVPNFTFIPTDPDHKKMLELADEPLAQGISAGNADAMTIAMSNSRRTGMISKSVNGAISGALRGTDPDAAMAVLAFGERLSQMDKLVYGRDMTKENQEMITYYRENAPYMSKNELWENLKVLQTPAEASFRKAAIEDATKALADVDDQDIIDAVKDEGWFDNMTDRIVGAAKGMAMRPISTVKQFFVENLNEKEYYDGMVDTYHRLYKENFVKFNKRHNDAHARTIEQLQQRWGPSTVGGTGKFMEAPPENYYGLQDGNGNNTAEHVDQMFREQLEEAGYIEPGETFTTYADSRTFSEINSGKKVGYKILVMRNGNAEYVTDQFGMLHFAPDDTKYREKYSKDAEEHTKNIKDNTWVAEQKQREIVNDLTKKNKQGGN